MANTVNTIAQEAKGEIILYQPDETIRLEVRMEDDTVWLSQVQMAELFQTTKNNITLHIGNVYKEITLHIGNVYKEQELEANATSKESLLVRTEGSLKDLGKKWFAFTLMKDLTSNDLLNRIELRT